MDKKELISEFSNADTDYISEVILAALAEKGIEDVVGIAFSINVEYVQEEQDNG
jgi:hypothetical protein